MSGLLILVYDLMGKESLFGEEELFRLHRPLKHL